MCSIARPRRGAHLLVAIPLLQQAVVFEHVERFFIGRARDLDMRRPAAELLVGRDALGEHLLVYLGEIPFLRPGDLILLSYQITYMLSLQSPSQYHALF